MSSTIINHQSKRIEGTRKKNVTGVRTSCLSHIELRITSTSTHLMVERWEFRPIIVSNSAEKTQTSPSLAAWPGCQEEIDTGDLSRAGPAYEAMEDEKQWPRRVLMYIPLCGYIEKA